MCVVSMIMDHFGDEWGKRVPHPWPWVVPATPVQPYIPVVPVPPTPPVPDISPEEVEEFRKLLERAREYDKRNNEPDCELEDKKRKVRELAEQLGVKIDFL